MRCHSFHVVIRIDTEFEVGLDIKDIPCCEDVIAQMSSGLFSSQYTDLLSRIGVLSSNA